MRSTNFYVAINEQADGLLGNRALNRKGSPLNGVPFLFNITTLIMKEAQKFDR